MIEPQQTQEAELSDAEATALLAELGEITLEQIQAAVPKQTPAVALGLDRGGLRQVQPVRSRRYCDRSDEAKLNAMELLSPLPPSGSTLHMILPGFFVPLELIFGLMELRRQKAKEVILATLGFSKANVTALAAACDNGQIKRLAVVCSTYFAAGSKEILAYAMEELPRRGAKVIASRSHCKIQLVKLDNGERWVFSGSANSRSTVALENFDLTRDARLYSFHKKWLTKILEAAPC